MGESDKKFDYYFEFIVMVVLSLICANIWILFIKKVLDYYKIDNPIPLLIASIAITMLSIGLAVIFFSKRRS
jgi:hypothetical protein